MDMYEQAAGGCSAALVVELALRIESAHLTAKEARGTEGCGGSKRCDECAKCDAMM